MFVSGFSRYDFYEVINLNHKITFSDVDACTYFPSPTSLNTVSDVFAANSRMQAIRACKASQVGGAKMDVDTSWSCTDI